jgi:hypothetical protein
MARFRLKSGFKEKDIGETVLKMAEAAGPNNGHLDGKELAKFREEFDKMLDPEDAKLVDFVFDTPKKIHLVIPFLGDYVYSDNDLANDAMGGICLKGCGK